MAKNKMSEVAKLLGLELEEKFKIKGSTTKYKLSKNGLMFWSDYHQDWFNLSKLEQLLIGYCEIIKLPKPILDDKEKEFLSTLVKPYRKYVKYLNKTKYGINERINICYREYIGQVNSFFSLPSFNKGTMYKGMELDKKYTLEELGL